MSAVLGRYLARTYALLLVSMLAGVVVIYVVIDFSDWLRVYVSHPWQDVAELYAWKSLVAAHQFAPAAMLLGAGATVTLLRRRGEWGAMQALGFSRASVVVPLALVGVVAAGALVAFDDLVVTRAGTRIDYLLVERFQRWGDFEAFYSPHRWFRVGAFVLNVRGGSAPDGALESVTAFELSPDFRLVRRVDAQRLVPGPGDTWSAQEAVERRFGPGAPPRTLPGALELRLPGTSPDTFRIQLGRPELMPFAELARQVAARARVGLSTDRFWYALHQRVSYPAGGLLGALLAAMLALRPARKSTLALALLEGAAIYVVLFASSLAGKALVLGEHLTPWGAAWAPPLLLGGLAWATWWLSERPLQRARLRERPGR